MVIEKVDVASCAKIGGIVAILIATVICIPMSIITVIDNGSIIEMLMILIFGPAVAGLDGILAGAFFAVAFNLASRVSGGLKLAMTE